LRLWWRFKFALSFLSEVASQRPFPKDIFIIPDGAPGALAELERRKFTAEEGVCTFVNHTRHADHLALRTT
jgi:hypothetical protein